MSTAPPAEDEPEAEGGGAGGSGQDQGQARVPVADDVEEAEDLGGIDHPREGQPHAEQRPGGQGSDDPAHLSLPGCGG